MYILWHPLLSSIMKAQWFPASVMYSEQLESPPSHAIICQELFVQVYYVSLQPF